MQQMLSFDASLYCICELQWLEADVAAEVQLIR